jgi:hypothetical protein
VNRNIILLVAVLGYLSFFDSAEAEPQIDKCAGILHKNRDDINFGGGRGEDEGICLINKSQEKKVLAVCSVKSKRSVDNGEVPG